MKELTVQKGARTHSTSYLCLPQTLHRWRQHSWLCLRSYLAAEKDQYQLDFLAEAIIRLTQRPNTFCAVLSHTKNEHRQHCRIPSSSSTLVHPDTICVCIRFQSLLKRVTHLVASNTIKLLPYILEVRSLTWVSLGSGTGRAVLLLKVPGESVFLPFPAFRDCCIPWLTAPSHPPSQQTYPSALNSASAVTPPSLPMLPPAFTSRTAGTTLGPCG